MTEMDGEECLNMRAANPGRTRDCSAKPSRLAIHLATAFAMLVLAVRSPGASVDSEEVKAALVDTTWIEVGNRKHVVFGVEKWSGPSDMSFKYKVKVQGGAIYLWVSILDDKIESYGKTPLTN